MCESPRDSGARGAFERGRHEIRTGRRTLLAAGASGIAISTLPGAAAAAAAAAAITGKRAYVLVLDGCRPDEIAPTLMPRTSALRDSGLNHPRATSLPVMETIPNHVMMMSGVRPDRSGVPANSILDRSTGEIRDMDRPEDIRVGTIIERLNRQGLTTATVLSKEYLYGIFGSRATHRWEPAPIVPVSGHAPDAFTMEAALAIVDEHDPHLAFVNLGDIDRFGHSDLTGPLGLKAARQAALAATDVQVGRFVDLLKSSGRWERALVVVLADHSMDWSLPNQLIQLSPVLALDPLLAGNVVIADNGGADLLYWTGDPALLDAAVARMIAVASAVPGVLAAHDPRVTPSLRTGPIGGDVIAYARAGWRFSDPDLLSNPIPGNHGHPATMPIPFFLAGGHPRVPRRTTSSTLAATIDVAPTIADFFGAGAPLGGYDGRSRLPRR